NIQPVGNFNSGKILFMGTMSYYPNIDGVLYFVEEILPIVWQQKPDISFCIAGREPPKIIQNLAVDNPLIEVIADPEDMSLVAAKCNISVVSLRSGSGTRIKILHSMAMGLPVVSTSVGCEGLDISDRQHLVIYDLPSNFAQVIVEFFENQELWQLLQNNGRQLVENNYNWTKEFNIYEQELLKNKVSIFD
ncbi:MAG: glycosyltransferase family 4 protein, partial [Pleurocapsa sp.]